MALNTGKLNELTVDGNFRAKVQAIMQVLHDKGYEDVKIAEAKRTKAQQADKVRKGYSKTMASNHVKRGSDHGCLAADIVPAKSGWMFSRRYALMFGWNCYLKGLGWGGLFGLKSTVEKQKVKDAMARLSEAGWPYDAENPDYSIRIGWDGAHVEKNSNWVGVR